MYIIKSGTGVMEIDGREIPMQAGDCVRIEPGQSQRITNTDERDLMFKSICRPRFTPDTYTNLENEDES